MQKTADDKIQAIRDMRQKGFSQLSQQDQDRYNKAIISPATLFEMRCNEAKMRHLGRVHE